MIFTPNMAKSIAEQFPGAKPVFSSRGERKGQHAKKAFRFEYHGTSARHISIIRTETKDGVTVYVNERSSNDIVFPSGELRPARVTEVYPRGHEGKTGDKGLSTAAAGLPTLDPKDNDVLRLSVSSEDSFRCLLAWYFGSAVIATDSNGHGLIKETGCEKITSPDSIASPTLGKETTDSFTQEEIEGTRFDANEIDSKLVGFEGEDRDVIAKRRVNQGKFRQALLRYWNGRCGVSEVAHAKLLIASHIVPWSKANSSEKGDPANGLLLSVLWDALFDRGLVSFRDDGSPILDKLDKSLLVCLGIDGTKAAISTEKLTPKHREYLNRHRKLYGFE